MRIAPEGWAFVLVALIATLFLTSFAVVAAGRLWTLAALAAALTGLAMIFFFRDPARAAERDPRAVIAPGEGRVLDVIEVDEPTVIGGAARRIAIFLSLFDVHVQRAPVAGRVVYRDYQRGEFAAAWGAETSERNERASLGLRTAAGPVLVRQIAGLVARRIVTYPHQGDVVDRCAPIGLIRFGSRVELFVPAHWEVVCARGDRVRVGETTVARAPGAIDEAPS